MRLMILILLSALSSMVLAQDWEWVKATNKTSGWDVTKGKGSIEIYNEKFTAKLYWGDLPNKIKYTLKGNIKNNKISVIETVHNSDFSGSTYTGTYDKKTWEGFADIAGAESINLSDGWSMIGISRPIKK